MGRSAFHRYAGIPPLLAACRVSTAAQEEPSGTKNKFRIHKRDPLYIANEHLMGSCGLSVDYGDTNFEECDV